MKSLLLIFFLFVPFDDIGDIAAINKLKKQAKESFLKKDFNDAIIHYKKLIDEYKIEDGKVLLNLGNAYFETKDTANASSYYQQLVTMPDRELKSQALLQLGVIAHHKENLQESLAFFKEALKANPGNEEARYNYELVKKKLKDKKENDQEEKDDKDKEKPSDYAKKLKEQAEALVGQRKYKDALDLMNNGLKKDPSVAHYSDFINRLNDVVEIEK